MIHVFWTWGTKILVFRRKIFDGFVKTAFNVSRGDFRANCFFYDFFQLLDCFLTVERTFCNLGFKFFEYLLKLLYTWATKLLRKICFLKKILTFIIFSRFDQKVCGHLSTNLPTASKTCFLHLFRWSSCITLSFSLRKFTHTKGLWGKIFVIP